MAVTMSSVRETLSRHRTVVVISALLLFAFVYYYSALVSGWNSLRFRPGSLSLQASSYQNPRLISVQYIPGAVFHNPDGTTAPDVLWYGALEWGAESPSVEMYSASWTTSSLYSSGGAVAVVGYEPLSDSNMVRLYVMKNGSVVYYADVPRVPHVDFSNYPLYETPVKFTFNGPNEANYIFVRHLTGSDISSGDVYLLIYRQVGSSGYTVQVDNGGESEYVLSSASVPAVAVAPAGAVYFATFSDRNFSLSVYPGKRTLFSTTIFASPSYVQPFVTVAPDGNVYFGYVLLGDSSASVHVFRYSPATGSTMDVTSQFSGTEIGYGNFRPVGRYHFAGAVGYNGSALVFGYPVDANWAQYSGDYWGGYVDVIAIDALHHVVDPSSFSPVSSSVVSRAGVGVYSMLVNPFPVEKSAAIGMVLPSSYSSGSYDVRTVLVPVDYPVFYQQEFNAQILSWTPDQLRLRVRYCGVTESNEPVTNEFAVSLWTSDYSKHLFAIYPATFTPPGHCAVVDVALPFSGFDYNATYRLYFYTLPYSPEDYSKSSGNHYVAFRDVHPADFAVAPPSTQPPAPAAPGNTNTPSRIAEYYYLLSHGGGGTSAHPLSVVQGVSGSAWFGLLALLLLAVLYFAL